MNEPDVSVQLPVSQDSSVSGSAPADDAPSDGNESETVSSGGQRISSDVPLYLAIRKFVRAFAPSESSKLYNIATMTSFYGSIITDARPNVGNEGLRVVEVCPYPSDYRPTSLNDICKFVQDQASLGERFWRTPFLPMSVNDDDDGVIFSRLTATDMTPQRIISFLEGLKSFTALNHVLYAKLHAVCSGRCSMTAIPGLVIVAHKAASPMAEAHVRCKEAGLIITSSNTLYCRDWRHMPYALLTALSLVISGVVAFVLSEESGLSHVLQTLEAMSYVGVLVGIIGLAVADDLPSFLNACKSIRLVTDVESLPMAAKGALLARELSSKFSSVLTASCSFKRTTGAGGLPCDGLAKVGDLRAHGFVFVRGWVYDCHSGVLKRMVVDTVAKITTAESDPGAWQEVSDSLECDDMLLGMPMV